MSASRTELIKSALYTSPFASPALQVDRGTMAMVGVDITAVSGTSPLLDCWLEGSDDGGTTWYELPADQVLKSSGAAAANSTTTNSRDLTDGANAIQKSVGIYKHLATDTVRIAGIITGTFSAGQGFTFSSSIVVK